MNQDFWTNHLSYQWVFNYSMTHLWNWSLVLLLNESFFFNESIQWFNDQFTCFMSEWISFLNELNEWNSVTSVFLSKSMSEQICRSIVSFLKESVFLNESLNEWFNDSDSHLWPHIWPFITLNPYIYPYIGYRNMVIYNK